MEDDARPSAEGSAMLYDFQKHLTSLCLFSLGGVLALADKLHGQQTVLLIGALIVIGSAGLISFTMCGELVAARFDGKGLPAHSKFSRTAAPMMLFVGVGMFIYLFTGTLKL